MTKLIYIGGYGRSGSTLLEYLLTTSPSVVACGEVARHLKRFGSIKTCTCGHAMQECPVWGAFQHNSRKLEGLDHQQLTLAILEHLAAQYDAMVDASKTAWGSFFIPSRLATQLGQDFFLIHLVRDPRAVCWSAIRTSVKHQDTRLTSAPILRCLRTCAGWMVANIACELFRLRHREQYVRLAYEDLARLPRLVSQSVLAKVSVQSPVDIGQNHHFDNRHQLYGNSMRFRPLSLETITEDVAWKQQLSKAMRRLTMVLCWPLAVRYGYVRAFSAPQSKD